MRRNAFHFKRDGEAQYQTGEQQQKRRDQHDLRRAARKQQNRPAAPARRRKDSSGTGRSPRPTTSPFIPGFMIGPFRTQLIQPEQHRDGLGLAHQVSPIQFVEIDDSGRPSNPAPYVRRHHRKVDVGAVPFGMGPDPPALVGRDCSLLSQTRPDHPAHGFQRALAADAMDDEDRGSFGVSRNRKRIRPWLKIPALK